MATLSLIPKVSVEKLQFDPDKWEKGKNEEGETVYTLKPGQTDDVLVDYKPPGQDETIACGEGSTITVMAGDYEIVKRP